MLRPLLLCAIGFGLVAPAHAGAQATDPALTIDQRFAPPDGVARDDLNGTSTDIPAAIASFADRVYTVGETRDTASNSSVGIVARRTDGAYDTSFDGDGKLSLDVAAGTGKDVGTDVVTLPNGSLRILASTDMDATDAGTNIATAVIGLDGNGVRDQSFGVNGVALFKASPGTGADAPTRLAVGPNGQIAVTGGVTAASGKEDSFVALLDQAGNLVPGFGTGGVRIVGRAPSDLNDRGVDVGFRPGGGILAYLRVETNPADTINDYVAVVHALDETGAEDARFNGSGDLQLAVGDPDTVAGGLLVYADRIWVSGATKSGQDTDAFIARLNADGSGVESRRFDMRGDTITANELVTSSASDLAVVAGPPATIVATGSINYSSRPYWAAAAFQGLDGAVASLRYGDLIIPTAEYGAVVGVAPVADGSLALAGSLVNTSSNFDTSYGQARLLLDVKKTCDLAIEVPKPLEFAFPAGTSAPVTVTVTNAGTRPCGGALGVSAGFALTGTATAVPQLDPGASYTSTGLALADRGPRRRSDVATFSVAGAGDTVTTNDTKPVRVRFAYCDVTAKAVGRAPLLSTEGARPFELSIRNVGTETCAGVGAVVTSGARRGGKVDAFKLPAGRSASVDVAARAARGAKPGRLATVAFAAAAKDAVLPDNDRVTVRARVAAPGDSRIRRTGARGFSGTATGGSGGRKAAKSVKRAVALRRVEVAIQRPGKRCATVTGKAGKLRVAKGKTCGSRTWIGAGGAAKWRLKLGRKLPKGRWVVFSRAIVRDGGLPEAAWSRRDRNTSSFRIR